MPYLTAPIGLATNIRRHWVGGTASWDATAGTKWAYSSGGPGGAPVPTASEDVYIDANSGAVIVTRSGAGVCRNLNCTGFTGTFAGTAATTISGSLTWGAGMTRSFSGAITFNATTGRNTITLNGKGLGAVTFNGVGGYWLLMDAFSVPSNAVTITNGTLDSNNQTLTLNSLTKAAAASLVLGSSTISALSWTATSGAGTVNAGTSSITITGSTFAGGGYTYYNLTVTGASSPPTITGTNTFNGSFVSTVTSTLSIAANQTFNGSVSINGTSQSARTLLTTSAANLASITLTCNGSAPTLSNLDIQGIIAAGTAGTWTGTSLGDCQGNSNITFTTPVTRYLIAGTTNVTYYSNVWSTSSGGSVGATVPLPQDTIVMDANSFGAGGGINVNSGRAPTLDFTNATNNPVFNLGSGTNALLFGDLILKAGMSTSGGNSLIFQGYGITQNLNTNGVSFLTGISCSLRNNGTLSLSNDLTLTTLSLTRGNFNQSTYTINATNIVSSTTDTKSWTGSGNQNLSGTSPLNISSASNLTITFTGGTMKFTNTSSNAKTVVFGGKTYNNVWFAIGGTGSTMNNVEVTSTVNTFNDFKLDPLATLTFSANSITNRFNTFTANGTSGNLITLGGSSNSLVSLTGTAVNCTFMSITNSQASGATFTATSSTNGGGNSGWTITP